MGQRWIHVGNVMHGGNTVQAGSAETLDGQKDKQVGPTANEAGSIAEGKMAELQLLRADRDERLFGKDNDAGKADGAGKGEDEKRDGLTP